MKNKKMIWVLAAVLVIVAVAAAYFAINGSKVEMAPTASEPDVTVVPTQEPTAEPTSEPTSEPLGDDVQPLSSDEEEIEVELVQLMGTITEITEEYVMLDAGEMGQIQVNLTEDTLIEGVEALEIGQVAFVTYNGMMTRSLPAQITGLRIGVYELKATVKQVEEGRILVEHDDMGEVVLTLPEDCPELAVGDVITAYTTGISTMSLPPIQNAVVIIK